MSVLVCFDLSIDRIETDKSKELSKISHAVHIYEDANCIADTDDEIFYHTEKVVAIGTHSIEVKYGRQAQLGMFSAMTNEPLVEWNGPHSKDLVTLDQLLSYSANAEAIVSHEGISFEQDKGHGVVFACAKLLSQYLHTRWMLNSSVAPESSSSQPVASVDDWGKAVVKNLPDDFKGIRGSGNEVEISNVDIRRWLRMGSMRGLPRKKRPHSGINNKSQKKKTVSRGNTLREKLASVDLDPAE